MFTSEEHKQVADAVSAIERDTDAEVVTVVASAADDYRWIGLFWAALAALVVPAVVLFFPAWLGIRDLVLIQWGLFVVLSLSGRLPGVAPRLVPRAIRRERAARLARAQFLAQNMHRTQAATGVLIFVSQAERYVEIIVDHGIAQAVPDGDWQAIIDAFTQRVRAGETAAGFVDCITACGQRLARAVPASHDVNELPNRLVVLDDPA